VRKAGPEEEEEEGLLTSRGGGGGRRAGDVVSCLFFFLHYYSIPWNITVQWNTIVTMDTCGDYCTVVYYGTL
jgi:hypothetical protein